MNDEQLAALTEDERIIERSARLDSVSVMYKAEDVLPLLTALADARLEVARLRETLAAERADGNEIYGMNKVRFRQQREDIRRLLEVAEAVCAKACLTGRLGEDGYSYQVGKDGSEALQALADTLAEVKERYDA